MYFSAAITEIIRKRFSCRKYLNKPIDKPKQQSLLDACAGVKFGPLGSELRFTLIASNERESTALKGLGTYGFIKNPAGFLVGTVRSGKKDLEDFGYCLEKLVLLATDLDLGTCWLGGSFTKRKFYRKISAADKDVMPAVVSCGPIEDPVLARKMFIRRAAGSFSRLGPGQLFFDASFGTALSKDGAGTYDLPLEMVRMGPSASNKQPWRIVRDQNKWHFFLQRTKGYPPLIAAKLLKIADIQRVDMGIAMCHFELTARELGMHGRWVIEPPVLKIPDESTEYSITWIGDQD
jgi:hypothetical protein